MPPSASTDTDPIVGVGVLVRRRGCVLLGLRLGSRGAGTWAPPGGTLESGESLETAALREVFEETGLRVRLTDITSPPTSDYVAALARTVISNFVVADYESGEARTREPSKCARWDWFPWTDLPTPLYGPLADALPFLRALAQR
jgi:8-oxo-dGTP diphosphatase